MRNVFIRGRVKSKAAGPVITGGSADILRNTRSVTSSSPSSVCKAASCLAISARRAVTSFKSDIHRPIHTAQTRRKSVSDSNGIFFCNSLALQEPGIDYPPEEWHNQPAFLILVVRERHIVCERESPLSGGSRNKRAPRREYGRRAARARTRPTTRLGRARRGAECPTMRDLQEWGNVTSVSISVRGRIRHLFGCMP